MRDEIVFKLAPFVDAELDEDNNDLPETVSIPPEALNAYFDSWVRYMGSGRKFLPEAGGLNDQNALEMDVIYTLDSLYFSMVSQRLKEKDIDNAT